MRRALTLLLLLALCAFAAAEDPRERPSVGIGFLWTQRSQAVVARLTDKRDFVDVILGPGRLGVFEQVKPPVRVACIALALERNAARPLPGIRETLRILRDAKIPPDRVIIAYNPERRPGTPSTEMDDLVGSVKRAREMADTYGAPLLVGPGLREMQQHDDLYPELATHCHIWLIQSQRLQLDLATRKPVPPAQYREGVKRIADLLRRGNPTVQIYVQLVTTAERGTVTLTAEQITANIAAVEDIVDAVRIYGGSPELLGAVLDARRAKPAAHVPPKQTVGVPMRDGATLATDLFMPNDYSPATYPDGVPVILICTPYGKDKGKPVDGWRDVFAGSGYAVAVQDMRGFHASAEAGKGQPRHHDGYDAIEWLAAQPWCNGKVGMFGYSHLGAAQYEAAVAAPPHLACAIPAQAPANYYTDAYFPPVFRKADMDTILRGAFTSRTKQLIRRRIRSRNTNPIPQFNTPMLHSAGWFDFYTEAAIEMFRACQLAGGPNARGNQKLLIGPWGHGTLQEEAPGKPIRLDGGQTYPPNAKPDWKDDVWLPWFDHWLKGKATGVMERPAVRYYLMGDTDDPKAPGNRWVEADTFPPKSTPVPYYAHADHTLSTEPPKGEGRRIEYRYDPADPVPTVGRRHERLPVKGPYDQREVEGRPDVVLFTTPALTEPLAIVGKIRVVLWASSDRKDTDFTAKLTDVYPDGRSMLITDSIVKARYRNGYLEEALLTPGEPTEFHIDLGCTALVLARGHRLRLAISSSNFDRFDINPNTGEPYGDHAVSRSLLEKRLKAQPRPGEPQYTESLVARNAIYTDGVRPTRVVLPCVDIDD